MNCLKNFVVSTLGVKVWQQMLTIWVIKWFRWLEVIVHLLMITSTLTHYWHFKFCREWLFKQINKVTKYNARKQRKRNKKTQFQDLIHHGDHTHKNKWLLEICLDGEGRIDCIILQSNIQKSLSVLYGVF